jgi:sulfatase maturation enzyme AslB (radical SAM superfamily)
MGIAECKLGNLTDKGLKYTVSGDKQEHLSLRCPDCNMLEREQGICKPQTGKTFNDCPFFGRDPLGLDGLFEEVEAPAPRTLSKKRQ